jgi:microcystin-dependent protein
MSLHVIVGKATAANAVLVSAPFAAFTGSKNLGQVAVQNVGGTITVNSVRQLGVGAGGSGIGQFFTGPVALTGSYTGDVIVYGDASLAGTSATITVNGNLTITGDLTNTGGNNLVVTGDMFVNSIDFEPSGATGVGNLTVDGDLNVSGTLAKISIVTDTVASAAMWMTGQITTTNDNSALVASGAIVTISNDPTYTGTVQNIFGNNVDCNPGFNINPTGATITFTTTDYYSVYAPTTSSSTSPSVITVGMNMISSRVWLASKDVSKSGGSINIGGDFNGQYINALSLEASIITTGSPGGTITIQGTCYNSSLNTNGATGSTAGYCSAGNITLGAFIGKAWNPGVRSIYAAGASISAAGDGGGGGAIKCSGPCYAQYLVTDGGAGYLGSGGGGGLITIMGELYCLHIQASGGNGGAGNGGSGGSLLFNSNVSISGNILFSGGSGTGNNSGGYAGYLTVGGDLVGVGSIQGNGGGIDQATNGAAPTSGASVTIYGNLTNVNSITLQGGSILSSVSGSQNAAIGGLLYVYGTTSSASGAGSIGVGGGNSTSGQGGKGGWLYFYAPISGLNLYANGGNSNAGSAKGGGGYVYVYMGGTVQTITTADGTTGTASTATTYIYLGGSVTVGSITAPNRANSAIRGVNAYNSILKVSSFTDLNQLTNHNGLNPITATSPQTDLYTYDATAACWCSLVQASSTPSTRNLIIAGSNFENNAVGGWQLFNVTLTSKIPTGAPTLGSATGMTVATTATNPISRGYSLQVSNTASANFAAGSGIISQAYSIDLLYQAKVLANTLAYRATTGAAFQSYNGDSSNTWAVYIYDVTNAAWIQPAGVYNLIQNSGVGNHSSTWQTPSNMTQFRIALVCITATTGSSPAVDTIQTTFDDFYAGPQSITQGMAGPVGEIISTGSITPDPGFLYCNGAAISRTQYSDLFSKIGTTYGVGDNSTTFNIPNLQGVFARGAGSQTITDGFGAIAHAATLGAAQNDMSQGHYHNLDATVTANIGQTNGLNIQYTNSAATGNYANVANNSGNRPAPQAQGMVTNGSSGTPRVGGETLPANVAVAYHIRYQASYQMSADTDTRVVAAILSGTPTGTIASLGAETIAKYPTVTRDSHSGYSASTGLYTVPVSGFYTVDASALITFSSGAAYLYGLIYQNGAVAVSQYYYASTASDGVARVHGDLYCIAGDTIGVHFASNGASPAFGAGAQNQFSIRRLSGPATIAASESVNVAYTNSTTPQTGINPNGSYILMSFPDKKIDSHGSWSGTTFTAKISGSFLVTGTVLLASTNILNNRYFACIHKNGTEFYRCTNITPPAGTDLGLAYSGIVPLLARETVQIYLYGAGNNSASTLSSGSGQVFITRVGN